MLNLHKLLYRSAPLKYVGVLLILIVSSVVNILLTNSFVKEDDGTIFMYIVRLGLLLLVMIYQYFLIRVLYRNELLLLKEDPLHPFMQSKQIMLKVFLYKMGQFFIFFLIQYGMICVFGIFLVDSWSTFMSLTITMIIGFVMILVIYSFDFNLVNKFKKNKVEDFFGNLLLVGAVGLFWSPSIWLFGAYCLVILIVIGLNFQRIRRSILC